MNLTVGVKLKAAYQAAKEQVMLFGNEILSGIENLIKFVGGSDSIKESLIRMRTGLTQSITAFVEFVGGRRRGKKDCQ